LEQLVFHTAHSAIAVARVISASVVLLVLLCKSVGALLKPWFHVKIKLFKEF